MSVSDMTKKLMEKHRAEVLDELDRFISLLRKERVETVKRVEEIDAQISEFEQKKGEIANGGTT